MNEKLEKKNRRAGLFNIKDSAHVKTKILKLQVLSIIMVVLFTSAVSVAAFYRNTLSTVTTFMAESADLAAGNISSTLRASLQTVEEFASRAYFIQENKDISEIVNYCNDFAARQGYITAKYVDAQGISTDGIDISDRDYFVECKATGQAVISDLILSKSSGEMILAMAAPIMKNNVFDGVIVAHADATFLSDLTKNIKIGETGSSYIIDSMGNTIAHDNAENILNQVNAIKSAESDSGMAGMAAVQKKMVAGERGFDTYIYQGTRKMLGYSPIGINGWSIGLSGSTSEFLRGVYLAIGFMAAVAAAGILLAIGISVRKVNQMVTPLQQCSNRIIQLGQGDLKTPFPEISSRDEIGAMAESSRAMIDSLGTIIHDVDYC